MNRRFISVLMFAFVVAGGASMILYKLVIGRMNLGAPTATSSILVATKNLDLGVVISDADLRVVEFPGVLPTGAIVKAIDAVGRGVIAPIYANEPVTESRLGERGAGGGLAATIPRGMRAVAIRVNEIVGVAGFVVAGTKVDVLVSGVSPGAGASAGNISRTILQNLTVLSAGQDFKKDNEGKPITVQVVNLLVTPEQAQMLSLASSQMALQLVLRNPLDTAIMTVPGISLSSMFSGEVRPAARSLEVGSPVAVKRVAAVSQPVPLVAVARPISPSPRMEIIQGSRRTEVVLQKKEVANE